MSAEYSRNDVGDASLVSLNGDEYDYDRDDSDLSSSKLFQQRASSTSFTAANKKQELLNRLRELQLDDDDVPSTLLAPKNTDERGALTVTGPSLSTSATFKIVNYGTVERVVRTREGIQEYNPIYIFNPNLPHQLSTSPNSSSMWPTYPNRAEVAIHSVVGGSDGPTCGLMNFIRERRDNLIRNARCVCRLFLRRETPAGIETDVATAIKVGPNRWLTVAHNMQKVFEIDCTSDLFAPRLAYRAISNYCVLSPISNASSSASVPPTGEDVDPSSNWHWGTRSDFVFLKRSDSTEDTVLFSRGEHSSSIGRSITDDSDDDLVEDFMVPDPTPLEDGEPVCLIAYHHPPLPSYLADAYSQPTPTVAHIHEHFVAFELKAVSPGKIIKVGDGLFSHTCSAMHGAAGGLLFRMNINGGVNYQGFCGIHLGSWKEKGINHSLALSVHHGSFVVEYVKAVLPYLIPTHAQMSEAIQAYIRKHEQHLKNSSADALRVYRQIIQSLIFKEKEGENGH
eukprot:TRINITY_DN8285_c0_g1_i1.p1 TRINITY_DN8285_c0_g1~~TRINITY_DN8285_c0_g1_i1.p1  ORF type:complete len:552 (-),score=103.21 TRINITY_DN8285_c0_g1_i1:1318-2844(-)